MSNPANWNTELIEHSCDAIADTVDVAEVGAIGHMNLLNGIEAGCRRPIEASAPMRSYSI